MPINTDIRIPFNPQEGVTGQILSAIQLANEHAHQQQQMQLQQQQLQQQAPLVQAQTQEAGARTGQIQAGLTAGLPQAEADYKNALATQQKMQTQYEEETHPLNKAILEQNLRNTAADVQKKELMLNYMKHMQGPDYINNEVDQAIPSAKYPELNKRTKILAQDALSEGGIEKVHAAIAKASDDISAIEKETNPSVIRAHAETAAETAIAVERAHQAMYPAALAGVTPQLIKPATDDATKADQQFTQAQQAGNEMHSMVDLAKKGNKIAYAYSPVTGVLQINVAGQIKRMNLPEIETYGTAGSALDRITGFLGKQATGASIPENVLNDMDEVSKMVTKGAREKYESDIKGINDRYGAKFNAMPAIKIKGAESETPTRPPGVPANATWNSDSRTWTAP